MIKQVQIQIVYYSKKTVVISFELDNHVFRIGSYTNLFCYINKMCDIIKSQYRRIYSISKSINFKNLFFYIL